MNAGDNSLASGPRLLYDGIGASPVQRAAFHLPHTTRHNPSLPAMPAAHHA